MPWGVIPPGGWHFVEQGIRLEGESRDALIKTLHDYRLNNALPIGEPERDVDTFICTSFPNLCGGNVSRTLDADEPTKVYGVPVRRRISERVGSWTANRYSKLGSIHTVEREEAERRSNICINCPQNDNKWREKVTKDCPPCKERLERLDSTLFQVRQGKSVVREKLLGACTCAGQDNATAVWLPAKQLQHARHYLNDLDPTCWMRNLIPAPEKQTSNSGQISLVTP
jgi:hypothetical protein